MTWGTVAVATRIAQYVDPATFNCWSRLLTGGLRRGDMVLPAPIGMAAHHAANDVARRFLASHCDSLLTVDSDQTFTGSELYQLRNDARGDGYAMLGAFYVARSSGLPLLYRIAPEATWADPCYDVISDYERGDIVDVDCMPLGFTLTRRETLLAVGGDDGPWFGYISPDATEDIGFSRAARAQGLRLGVHTGVPIGHVIRGTRVPYDDVDL